MSELPIGISDIRLYVPRPQIEIATIVKERVRRKPDLEKSLVRACDTTGQKKIRFPEGWEDTATLAAQSAVDLFKSGPQADPSRLRYLTVGTETPIDHSKAVAAYVEGMLQKAGVAIPKTISTFQVQHACAGGALGAISVGALLALSNRRRDSGLVICSDIARYQQETTAEVTQGSGATALLVENDPKLIELDLSNMGFSSEDVDDFFRPLGSVVAKVKGGYSIQCYNTSFDQAFVDYCERQGESPRRVLESTDYFVLHVPFRNMAFRAMMKLLGTYLDLSKEESEKFLAAHAFEQGVDPIANIGNTYTASIFMSLAFLLDSQYRLIGPRIVGKRILLASYGSGNTMAIISARVAQEAPRVLASWRMGELWKQAREAQMSEYQAWIESTNGRGGYAPSDIPRGMFYLGGVREDGYREYEFK